MKIKKIISGLMAFTMLCGVICTDNSVVSEMVNNISVSAETFTLENGLEYEIVTSDEGTETITITDFDNSAESVEIPAEIDGKPVTRIGNMAFRRCDSVSNIIIPETVTSIGDSAFDECTSLTEISIPDSVNLIQAGAFRVCTKLNKVKLPANLKAINNGMFSSCKSLTEVNIPETVKSIGDGAFSSCESLEHIDLPDYLTSIGGYAFSGCKSLTEIVIPYNIKVLTKGTFDGCTNLTSITLPKKLSDFTFSIIGSSNLKDIYYTGTKEEWRNISFIGIYSYTPGSVTFEYTSIDENSDKAKIVHSMVGSLDDVTIHYNVPDPIAPAPVTPDTSWFDSENLQESYDISTAEQLAGLAQLVNNGNSMEGIIFNLTADIKMNDTSDFENWYEQPPKNIWIPIGNQKNVCPFSGYFNGNGHRIEGMYVYTESYGGLFGFTYGSAVVNLIMKDCFIFTESNPDVFDDNCFVYSGGVVGLMDGGLIDNCDFDGKVYAYGTGTGLNVDSNINAGGIVGAFTISDASVAGGLFGNLLMGVFSGYILIPTLVHSVSGGGGSVVQRCLVSNCINRGEVHITNASMGDGSIGGIAGFCHTGKILSCINIGSMFAHSGDFLAGGVIGQEFNTCMEKCYYQSINLDKGVGLIRGDGAVLEDEKPEDNAIRTTADEIAALSQEELEEKLTECFINVGNKTHLKCDLRYADGTISGDANGDNKVDVRDITALKKYIVKISDIEEINFTNADIIKDGVIDVKDIGQLIKYVIKVIDEF